MTAGQMELPLSTYSSAADPTPEQVRAHPAQMIIKHCGKQRKHVEHTYRDAGWWGCPGVPDIRERHTVEQQARDAAERVLERDRLVREMEIRTYNCGIKSEFHEPHPIPGGTCPGLTVRYCGRDDLHPHHRWWVLDAAFHWCNGTHGTRRVETVELPGD